MSRHVVVATPPAPGHVHPTLPLIAELARRGHRVSFITSPAFAPTVEAAGATAIELNWQPDPASLSKVFSVETLVDTLSDLLGNVRRELPAILEHFRDAPPDLVCSDAVVLGPLLANLFGTPRMLLAPTFVTNSFFTPHSLLPGYGLDNARLQAFVTEVETLYAEYSVASAPDPNELLGCGPSIGDPDLTPTLVLLPQAFQVCGESFGPTYRFVGPSVSGRSTPGGWAPPAGTGRTLLVAMGTAFNDHPEFYALCLEAFGGTDWHVVMSIGDRTDESRLRPRPPNVEIARYVPQLDVLNHADAFISHAGMNSAMEALYHQVPLITVPQMQEQVVVAERIEELGLGRRLYPSTVDDARTLRRFVEDVADDGDLRARLGDMKREMVEAGGAVAGAAVVESLLDTGTADVMWSGPGSRSSKCDPPTRT